MLNTVGVKRLVRPIGAANTKHLESLVIGSTGETEIGDAVGLPREARQKLCSRITIKLEVGSNMQPNLEMTNHAWYECSFSHATDEPHQQ